MFSQGQGRDFWSAYQNSQEQGRVPKCLEEPAAYTHQILCRLQLPGEHYRLQEIVLRLRIVCYQYLANSFAQQERIQVKEG